MKTGEQTAADSELLAAYDADLRGAGELAGAADVGRHGRLWWGRYGDYGMVSYPTDAFVGLNRAGLDALIAAAVAHFTAAGVAEMEWKTRGHDPAPALDEALRAHGFVPEEVETVMVGEAAPLAADLAVPSGLRVRTAGEGGDLLADVRRAQAMQDEVFGRPSGLDPADLAGQIAESRGDVQLWLAETDDGEQVVAAGRVQVVSGTAFAGLWGGATRAEWRGRGAYRALVGARARVALDRGARLLHSDCSPMSRPILARSGLRAITTTTPYVRSFPPAAC